MLTPRSTSEFIIEAGIPEPPKASAWHIYPFRNMKVGESFFIPKADYKRVSAAAYVDGRRYKRKFRVRKVDGGYRCWRIK